MIPSLAKTGVIATAAFAIGVLGFVFGSIGTAATSPIAKGRGLGKPNELQAASSAQRATPKYESLTLRGKVVELGPHLLQAFNVPADDDMGKANVALVTDSGDVYPLVKDVRSRGFWMDKRLRDRPMELHVHKFPGLPFVRVIDTYSFKDGKKFAVDYWCTVCAITTFEPGPCPCCQDEIELRERPADR